MPLRLYIDTVEYAKILMSPSGMELFLQITALFLLGIMGGYLYRSIQ